jgi:hypothetical protein
MVVISKKEEMEMHFQLYLLSLKNYFKTVEPELRDDDLFIKVFNESTEQLESFFFYKKVRVEDDVRSMLHEMLDKLNRLGYLPDAITRPDLYK